MFRRGLSVCHDEKVIIHPLTCLTSSVKSYVLLWEVANHYPK